MPIYKKVNICDCKCYHCQRFDPKYIYCLKYDVKLKAGRSPINNQIILIIADRCFHEQGFEQE